MRRPFCVLAFRSAQISLMLQLEQNLLHHFIDAQTGGIDGQLRIFRHFVGVRHTGEFRDQPARALAYRPLRSRDSQVSIGVAT